MEKKLSQEEKIELALYNSERALAYYEIQKVWAAHAYCYRSQQQRYELEHFWAKEHDDIMYAHGPYAFVGRDVVTKYYAEGNEIMNRGKLKIMSDLYPDEIEDIEENLGIGDLVIRCQTTSYIEIAEDNKTAKGIWKTPGFNTEIDANGENVAMFMVGTDCVDFVKESDGWKIWHYRDSADFGFPVPKDLIERDPFAEGGGRTVDGAFPDPNRLLIPFAESGSFTSKRVAKFSPEFPAPYNTWSEDISWAKPADDQSGLSEHKM